MAKKTKSEVADAMGVEIGPSLYISDKNYDGISKLTVGETVTMTITGKVQSVSQDMYSGSTSKHANIRISKINNKPAARQDDDEDDYED